MGVIYGDTADFKGRPSSPNKLNSGKPSELSEASCQTDRQTHRETLLKTVFFKVIANTCCRRNLKRWDNFLIGCFGQKLVLVGYFFPWRFYSQMKNESRFWGLAGTLPEETGKEEMGKMGITFPSCWLCCDVQSFLTSKALCTSKGKACGCIFKLPVMYSTCRNLAISGLAGH